MVFPSVLIPALQWWWPITFQTERDTRSESSDMTLSDSEEEETERTAVMANGDATAKKNKKTE